MSTCPRCSGKDGAHYMECVVGRLFERIMGDGYPWKAPVAPADEFVAALNADRAEWIQQGNAEAADPKQEAHMQRLREEAADYWREPEVTPEPVETTADRMLREGREAHPETTGRTFSAPEPTPEVARREEIIADAVAGAARPDVQRRVSPDLVTRVAQFLAANTEDCEPTHGVEVETLRQRFNREDDGADISAPQFGQALNTLIGERYRKQSADFNAGRSTAYAGLRLHDVMPVRMPLGSRKESAVQAAETRRKAVEEPVLRFAEERLNLGEFQTGESWVKRRDYISSPDLTAAYNKWAKDHDAPQLQQKDVSAVIKSLGYETRQTHVIKGVKPALFFGITLREEGAARETDDKEDHTARIRSLMKAAKARKPDVVEPEGLRENVEPEPADSADQPTEQKTWGTPAQASDVHVPELTVQDILAEHPEVEERAGGDRGRPGNERMSKGAREFINALIDLGAGFSYTPPIAQRKGFVKAPDGSRFPVAQTFSGGHDTELRQLRRWLNRHDYLPTAGSPVADLHLPGKGPKSKPVEQAKPAPTLVRKMPVVDDGHEPGVDPDTVERATFQVWSRHKNGLDPMLPLDVLPDVASLAGYDAEQTESVARNPQRVEIRPESAEKGYPVLGFIRGDNRVIMGFRFPDSPVVVAAYWTSLLAPGSHGTGSRPGSGGHLGSDGLPKTPIASMRRLRGKGASVTAPRDATAAEVFYDGQSLGKISVGEGVARVTVEDDYKRCVRKMQAIDIRAKAGTAV